MLVFHDIVNTIYEHTVNRALGAFDRFLDGDESQVIHMGSPEERLLLPSHEGSTGNTHGVEFTPGESSEVLGPLAVPTFKSVGEVIGTREEVEDLSHTVAFVASAESPLFGSPTKEFDTVITHVPYGSMIMVLEEKGRFSKVAKDGLVGWMLRDDLRAQAAHVLPEFVAGEENAHDDPNTLRLRAYIKDEFHGGETESCLQAGEYVVYMLARKNLNINWPSVRPRTPGLWHTILKGVPGVYIGIAPKTGSIMEYTLPGDIGHLAYVEAVFPDERISASSVNLPDHGIYSEQVLTKEEWQALNPVFLQFS